MARSFWDRIAAQTKGDKEHLRRHGLDKPLRRRLPGERRTGHDWQEIDRQVLYLLSHYDDLPPSVAARRATHLLAHFMTGDRAPTGDIVYLFGQILKVASTPFKYQKKPAALEYAINYLRENPDASNIQIAGAVGVHKTTVGHWKEKGLLK